MLNMTYDVPVKLFAFHLILLSCFLLAPDVPRLVTVLLLNRATAPSTRATLQRRTGQPDGVGRANRVGNLAPRHEPYSVGEYWSIYGGGRPYSALYGIWDVPQMWIDGQPRPPLSPTTDAGGAPSSTFPLGWPFSGWTIRSPVMPPPSISRQNPNPHQEGRPELESELHLSASCPGSVDPRWQHGPPSGSHRAQLTRPQEVPARRERLPLDTGVSFQSLV